MRIVKLLPLLAVAAMTGAVAHSADMKMPAMEPNACYDQIKTLAGDWQSKTSEGKAVKASYRVVSSGAVVEETLDTGDGDNMITMYRVENGVLVMDHYCSMNNVPHMRASRASNAKKIDFAMISASNMKHPTDVHMHNLSMEFDGTDHFSETWSLHEKGRVLPVVFDFTRAK